MDFNASKTRNVVAIISLAAMLAAIFDYLFFGKMIGLSVFVFVAMFLAILYRMAAEHKFPYRSSLWLLVPILFFAIMPAIRANPFLSFLNIVAVLGLLLLTVKELLQEHIARFGIKEYFLTIFATPFKFLINSIRPLRYALDSFRQSSTGNWRRVVIGILMAVPALIIFTLLFSSADLVFRQFVNSIFSVNIPDSVFQQAILMFVVFIGMLGIFEYVFRPSTGLPLAIAGNRTEADTTGREVETGVFLALIGMLFLIFIVFQITYLFGGDINIASRGFTYAEYARQGFWELLVVAAMTLFILFVADKYTHREISKPWFKVPATTIILEILIIIISAFKRLMLYQNTYGMTLLRFYVAGFIIFLGVIFLILAIKFVLEKKESFFTFSTLITMIAFLAGVNLINPDAFIAKQNIARFNQTGKIDAAYLDNLLPDAAPQVIAVYGQLNDEDKNTVKEIILTNQKRWDSYSANWQSYNVSTSKASRSFRLFIQEKF